MQTQTRSATWIAFGAAAVFGFGVACVVELPPNGKYACTSDADCGGNNYVCTPASAGPQYCCQLHGDEVCDGTDNDCNGVIDDVAPDPCYSGNPATQGRGLCHGGTKACADAGDLCLGEVTPIVELCNQADDDCDGVNDNGIDLNTDNRNCGMCGRGCSLPLRCEDGGCAVPTETNCADGLDNEGDNATDCIDNDCVNQPCGTGCTCRNFAKSESLCSDGADNDGDIQTDCDDSDCDGGACAVGCQCVAGGGRIETGCGDGADNDGDGPVDCDDPDCNNQSCGTGCTCVGTVKVETVCSDTVDNDGDNDIDCLDANCDGGSCGTGCTCSRGAMLETACFDTVDNNGDGGADCADTNCDGGACNVDGGTGCQCLSGRKVETNCFTNPLTGDEDGDGPANCADPDCLGRPCRSGRTCQANGNCQ